MVGKYEQLAIFLRRVDFEVTNEKMVGKHEQLEIFLRGVEFAVMNEKMVGKKKIKALYITSCKVFELSSYFEAQQEYITWQQPTPKLDII